MTTRLRLADVTQLNLVPVACVAVTSDHLRELGVEFEHGVDDLDGYAIAAFELNGGCVFAVSRYDHAPTGDFDLLIEDRDAAEPALSSMIRRVAEELGVPGARFSWMVNGQPARLSAA